MELTFVNDLGQSFVVEIDPNMELENVMALLEAEVRQADLLRLFFIFQYQPAHPENTIASQVSPWPNKSSPSRAAN